MNTAKYGVGADFGFRPATEQEQAKAYVRKQRPALMELSFGCEVIVAGIEKDNPGCEHDVVVDDRKDEHGRIGMGYFGHVHPDDFQEIIGHPIQLNDWLGVLRNHCEQINYVQLNGTDYITFMANKHPYKTMLFNLTTGQPATQADFKAFNDIVSV